jgi:hypothetical protein
VPLHNKFEFEFDFKFLFFFITIWLGNNYLNKQPLLLTDHLAG